MRPRSHAVADADDPPVRALTRKRRAPTRFLLATLDLEQVPCGTAFDRRCVRAEYVYLMRFDFFLSRAKRKDRHRGHPEICEITLCEKYLFKKN